MTRGGGVSRSAAKALRARIDGEKKRGISTFLFRRSGTIGAFATDSDNLRRRGPTGGPLTGLLGGDLGSAPPRAHGRAAAGRTATTAGASGAERCTSHSKVQFQPSFSRAKRTSRVQNAHLDGEEAGRGRRGPRRRSRRGAPLQQIWTRPRPESTQELRPHHPVPAHPHHRADPDPRTVASDEKGSVKDEGAQQTSARGPVWG